MEEKPAMQINWKEVFEKPQKYAIRRKIAEIGVGEPSHIVGTTRTGKWKTQ